MISPASLAFLKRLLATPAPSGFEGPAARVWREEAATFADKVTQDVAGNSIAEVNPGGSPTIMLDGHIDEIGLIVQYIDDDGFVYIAPIGGWDPQVLIGQRIRFRGNEGDVLGVRPAPNQVPGLRNIVKIAAANYHLLALADDGRVWAWGWNDRGQLGRGTISSGELVPARVAVLNRLADFLQRRAREERHERCHCGFAATWATDEYQPAVYQQIQKWHQHERRVPCAAG